MLQPNHIFYPIYSGILWPEIIVVGLLIPHLCFSLNVRLPTFFIVYMYKVMEFSILYL